MDNGTEHYTVDEFTGNLRDADTGELTADRFKHPRDTDKYHFATVLQERRRQQWTPDVVIKTVKTGDR